MKIRWYRLALSTASASGGQKAACGKVVFAQTVIAKAESKLGGWSRQVRTTQPISSQKLDVGWVTMRP